MRPSGPILRETTTRVLASLTPREERVLRMRFGIGMNTDHTLEEVGKQFDVTRERIRQIEAKALRKLFWWRNDDAAEACPALSRLLDLAVRFDVPLHLAAIPARLDEHMAAEVWGRPQVRILQHGFTHQDHIGVAGKGASELGSERPIETRLRDLAAGWAQLHSAGLPRLLPVLVPPWNRISDDLVPHLSGRGYRMLSVFGVRQRCRGAGGLLHVNCHVDPIKWRGGARFCGEDSALTQVVDALSARRRGAVDPAEPCGFLSHHLDSDEATWAFMERFFAHTTGRRGLHWIPLESLIDSEEAADV